MVDYSKKILKQSQRLNENVTNFRIRQGVREN